MIKRLVKKNNNLAEAGKPWDQIKYGVSFQQLDIILLPESVKKLCIKTRGLINVSY